MNTYYIELGSFSTKFIEINSTGKQRVIDSVLNSIHIVDDKGDLDIEVFESKIYNQIKNNWSLQTESIIKGYATAIYRNAENSHEVLKLLADIPNLDVIILSVSQECNYSFQSFFLDINNHDNLEDVLYFDIGGGSIDVGYFKNRELKSFGSIRVGLIHFIKLLFNQENLLEVSTAISNTEAIFESLFAIQEKEELKYVSKEIHKDTVVLVTGSMVKKLKKAYRENYTSNIHFIDNLLEDLKEERASYKNIGHLRRKYYKTNIKHNVINSVSAYFLCYLLRYFGKQTFVLNPNGLSKSFKDI